MKPIQASESQQDPWLTVAICTHNRRALLERCLDAMRAQDGPSEEWEILVVDNASTDGTAQFLRRVQEARAMSGLRCVREERLGLGISRNRAIREARGAFIAFVDDDAAPVPGWFLAVRGGFGGRSPRPTAVGGRVSPDFESRPSWFDDRLETDDWGSQARFLAAGESFSGNNMVFDLETLRRWGGFDESLAMTGRRVRLGDDTELFLRVWSRWPEEARFLYEPEAEVRHWIPRRRTTIRAQLGRAFAEGVATAALRSRNVVGGVAWADRPAWASVAWSLASVVSRIRRESVRASLLQELRPVMRALGDLTSGTRGLRWLARWRS